MSPTASAELLVGLDAPDDAAVLRIAEDVALVQTVDFFTPIVDDPWDWGRIAAANALSDIYAMGARPLTALDIVAWPRGLDLGLLGRVLEGAQDACVEAGISIVGGHSIDDDEPKFGLAVTGTVHPDRVIRKRGARAGCELVLTKPLGTGIISSGIKEGRTGASAEIAAIEAMSSLNRAAAEAMIEVGVAAATDVTGFGLIGHLLEMLDGRLGAELFMGSIPLLEEASELVREGVYPGGSRRNLEAARESVNPMGVQEEELALLCDAQTSGGLLIATENHRVDYLLEALVDRGVTSAARIGRLIEGAGEVTVHGGG